MCKYEKLLIHGCFGTACRLLYDVAIERLDKLLIEYDDIPSVLQKWIRKKIIPHLKQLVLFTRDGLVSRTNNPVENCYRQTYPDQIKNKYKTARGILSYLMKKMEHWNLRHGKVQHKTG